MQVKRTVATIMLVLAGLSVAFTQGQCKLFAKKKCMFKLSPFVSNGQLNNSFMNPGQTADIMMNFNAGQTYRIIVCSEEVLGEIEYQIQDGTGKVLFSNKIHDYTDFWDFNVKETTQLKLSVKVPELEDNSRLMQGGCVSVLVGFKK